MNTNGSQMAIPRRTRGTLPAPGVYAAIVGSSTWQDSVDRGSALSSVGEVGEVGAAAAGFVEDSSSPPPHPRRAPDQRDLRHR